MAKGKQNPDNVTLTAAEYSKTFGTKLPEGMEEILVSKKHLAIAQKTVAERLANMEDYQVRLAANQETKPTPTDALETYGLVEVGCFAQIWDSIGGLRPVLVISKEEVLYGGRSKEKAGQLNYHVAGVLLLDDAQTFDAAGEPITEKVIDVSRDGNFGTTKGAAMFTIASDIPVKAPKSLVPK